MLEQWREKALVINASQIDAWFPIYKQNQTNYTYGTIAVYAPYPNITNSTSISKEINSVQYVNTSISFYTYSKRKSRVIVGMKEGNEMIPIGSFNVTPSMEHFTLNTRLISGPYGNILSFITQNSSQVYFYDITFSKGRG